MSYTKKIFWLWLAITLTITGWLLFSVSHADEVGGTLSNGIDQGLSVTLPCTPASVSNGDVNTTTCAITCHANYTLNGTTCTANQTSNGWGWWWGGWGSQIKDNCPNGDLSPSLYDGICTGTWRVTTGTLVTTGTTTNNEHPTLWSIVWSPFSDELNNAYLYAYHMGITTMPTIQEADITWNLIRSHMAKMIVNFAIKVSGKQPNTSLACNFSDIANETPELQWYMKLACQLGLMWYESDGVTQSINFYPNDMVTRAQFGTVLSRLLRGTTYANANGTEYYLNHLQALVDNGIITNNDPNLQEVRWYVMLMLMRSAQ